MIAGAFQQMLKANGLSPVHVGGFGDYTQAGAPSWAVHAEAGAEDDMASGSYVARLQLRTRAKDAVTAEEAARTAFDLIRAADGGVLTWADPTGGAGRNYRVEAIAVVQRPTWFPTPEPGEETSSNFRLSVTEL